MEDKIYQTLKKELNGKLKINEPLAPYTTFKIGGPARYFYFFQDKDDFIKAIALAVRLHLPYFVLGGGSNILVSDKGFSGLVIKKDTEVDSRDFKIIGNKIISGAQVKLSTLVNAAAKAGLSGLEWAAGIPGTVGGAVRGNAGAYGGQMAQVVKKVEAKCFENGEKSLVLNNKDLQFSYRYSFFKKNKNCVIINVELVLEKGDKEEIKKKIRKILKTRHQRSAPQFPCAGSVFKNPFIKDKELLRQFEIDTGKKTKNNQIPAGYLIDKAGLKGKKIGGAQVSEVNANFILNVNKATAENVITLISLIKQQVRDKFGIQLEEEIELVGF